MPSRPPGDPLPPINFAALASALLTRAETLVPAWLSGGKRQVNEWVCGSLSGGGGTSCSVNLTTGRWSDFATDDAGGDLISLYAAINGLGNGEAALQLARQEGLEDVAGVVRQGAGALLQPRPPPPVPPASSPSPSSPASDAPAARAPDDEGWKTLTPVPPNAPAPTFRHQYRLFDDIVHTAAYRMEGHTLGYVVRFRTSDGGKETLPYTWCTSARDGASRWHWRQWDMPRPLYVPLGSMPAGRTVVLVEGELKADVLQELLEAGAPGVYLVASWPGGCKAWKKAMWDWLKDCTVLLWPDCDGKREPLTKKEREQCADELALETAKARKPLLPAHKQPGMAAMLGIGGMLRDWRGCTVQLLPIPAPGTVLDGWDCKDAIADDGWDFARVQAFFGQAGPTPPDAGQEAAGRAPGGAGRGSGAGGGAGDGAGPPPGKKRDGPAEADGEKDAFQDHLDFICGQLGVEVHEIGVNRKLVIAALRKAPLLRDCLGFNELTNAPWTRIAWPWRSDAGPLLDRDDLRLGDWLCRTYHLKACSRAALAEAIDTVADERHFHPIRDWLEALVHDGTTRIDKWLIHALGLRPQDLPPKRRRYLEMVGRFMLLGLVARVMQPGCKFDYSPVFEGLTGMRKSTLIKTLVGEEFFSDTHFDIGTGKDGFEQLEGLWGYELSELTALRRADSEQVKQFFSSQVDRFRGAYGRFVQPHPRQCMIFCSTNKRHYLYDLTGNRRFWPIRVTQPIRIEWVAKWRGQLFAEALALYRAGAAGAAYAPTLDEERVYFVPEQQKRLVETAVQSRLFELLTREGAPGGEGKLSVDFNLHTTFVTLDRLVTALGADAAKSNSILEGQIRGWLESYGWVYGRESTGQRRRGYRQPPVWPPEIEEEEPDDAAPSPGADDGPPAQAGPTIEGSDDDPF